jgi:CO/xanthine dehydrogenase Mo-binding subunit
MPSKLPENKKTAAPEYGKDHKLIGKDYTTLDLYAKVTGRSKYAEDYRAEGMLFCKLLLSPMPHARVRHIDASAALAMPGVKAILTEEDLPAPADSLNDNGQVIHANKLGERGLANEPLYQGEPILAVAAVDELTAAEAIEKIKIDIEPLPFAIDPLETLRPGSPNPRIGGNTWYREPPPAGAGRGAAGRGGRGAAPAPMQVKELKWTQADFDAAKEGQLPLGKIYEDPGNAWSVGDVEAGFKKAALVLDESFLQVR